MTHDGRQQQFAERLRDIEDRAARMIEHTHRQRDRTIQVRRDMSARRLSRESRSGPGGSP